MDPKTYAQAGVDIHKAESFLARLKVSARRKGHDRLWPASGGYASVYPINETQAVAMTTDGVGTKLLLAIEQDKYDTIGIDLVAMCANDLICVGAKPVAFLDYYATGALDERVSDLLLEGIVKGCDKAGMLLVGGETAEMPDLYQKGHFDIAGFAIGNVTAESLLSGANLKAKDVLIGVASSGIHSNGLSLARKIIPQDSPLRAELLIATLIYATPVVRLLSEYPGVIKAMAHITGGGWTNITRPDDSLSYHLEEHLPVPPVLEKIADSVPTKEMYKTFNMGMGLTVMAEAANVDTILRIFKQCGFEAKPVGEITDKKASLTIKGASLHKGEFKLGN
ncbi:MAG: phosphoribosylformylglycinamidine cyclo-ligase [Candidatus Obscuribacterales bacterium]|nr:phosphoribosylformylglycinamidine cyclo-ligase [Candidatus Obscuribacterales bacterium]